MPGDPTTERLRAENEELRARLDEAEATLDAIRKGEVDAVVVAGADGHRVYALEGADQFYRVLIEAMQPGQGAASLGTDGTILYCNRSFAALLNVAHEKVGGRSFHDYVSLSDLPVWQTILENARTAQAQGELWLQPKVGPPVPVHLAVNALPLSGAVALGLVVTDLTERKRQEETARRLVQEESARAVAEELARQAQRAEATVRESEARFRQLADALPQMVWMARPDGFIDYYNERWYDYTGFSRGEFGDQGWMPILHPDDLQRTTDVYFGCIRSGQLYQIEYRFKDRRTGGYRWFLGRAYPVRDEHGRILHWFGTCTDIDDTKKASEALLEADRRKDDFLATLAHELRNPLAPIRNAAHIMKLKRPSDPALLRSQDIIERQVSHLTRLVDDLLDVSRITRGKITLRTERVGLATILTSAMESSRPVIEAAGHELNIAIPAEPLYLEGDPTRLVQVFGNILVNAAKYTDRGGRIQLTARRDGSDAVVSVADNGIGIPVDHLPKLFEMFSQVDSALERTQGGLGIGLSLVKGLVEMHHGRVEARSDGPGCGSEFIVRLPLLSERRPATRPDRVEHDINPPLVTKWRVLVADDNVRLSRKPCRNVVGNGPRSERNPRRASGGRTGRSAPA